jgi:hypothetical protein
MEKIKINLGDTYKNNYTHKIYTVTNIKGLYVFLDCEGVTDKYHRSNIVNTSNFIKVNKEV